MKPLFLMLKKREFDAVKYGNKAEVTKEVTNKRIHYLCFAHMTKECSEKQSQCRKCFENARQNEGYMCYPFELAIIKRGKTDRYMTRRLTNVFYEERDGKDVFVIRFQPNEDSHATGDD